MISTLLSRVWVWVAGAAAALAMLGGVFLSIRKGGKDAARAEAAIDVGRRTREATQARVEGAKPVTQQKEAEDVYNRDRG